MEPHLQALITENCQNITNGSQDNLIAVLGMEPLLIASALGLALQGFPVLAFPGNKDFFQEPETKLFRTEKVVQSRSRKMYSVLYPEFPRILGNFKISNLFYNLLNSILIGGPEVYFPLCIHLLKFLVPWDTVNSEFNNNIIICCEILFYFHLRCSTKLIKCCQRRPGHQHVLE